MDVGPIGFGFAPRALLAAMAGIQHRLQHPVAHRRRQRPAQPRRRGALQAQRDGAARQAQRPRDLPVAGAALVLQAQNLSYATHRHSLGWHRSPRSSLADKQSAEHRPAVERLPPLLGVADFKSEWPRSNRNQWPTSFRNRRPTSPGICIQQGNFALSSCQNPATCNADYGERSVMVRMNGPGVWVGAGGGGGGGWP